MKHSIMNKIETKLEDILEFVRKAVDKTYPRYYNVYITNIEYCIENEDVYEEGDDDEICKSKINQIKEGLPKELTFTMVGDRNGMEEDEICDRISDVTGWLVVTYNYEIKEIKNYDDTM